MRPVLQPVHPVDSDGFLSALPGEWKQTASWQEWRTSKEERLSFSWIHLSEAVQER
jgi:hypothetical protein